MAIACFFLISHPEILARLKKDIWKVMPNKDIIPQAKLLEELPYMVNALPQKRLGPMDTNDLYRALY